MVVCGGGFLVEVGQGTTGLYATEMADVFISGYGQSCTKEIHKSMGIDCVSPIIIQDFHLPIAFLVKAPHPHLTTPILWPGPPSSSLQVLVSHR